MSTRPMVLPVVAVVTGPKLPPKATTPLLTRRFAVALALIVILGAGLRLALFAQAPAFTAYGDSAGYFAAGHNLARNGDLALPLKRPPLYPLFLAGIIATVGPSLEAVAAAQHALGLGTVVLAYFVGALAFGRVTGLVAALGTAVNGALLLMEQTVMSEALFAPILLAGLLLLLLALRSGRLGPLLAVGLMLGLGALDRPAAQAVLPLVVGLVVVQPCPWRWWAAAAGLLGLGFLMVVGPWMLRDRAVPQAARMSAGLGDSLFARVHRYDPGFEFRDRAKPSKDPSEARIRNRVFELARVYRYPKEVRAALQAEFGLTDAEGDAALRDAAIQVIRQEPRRYLEGTLDMFIQLGLGFEKPLDEFWETRTKPKNAQEWPEPVRFVMAPVEPPSEAAQALLESLTNLYQDHRAAGLVGVLFLVGTIRSLAGDRRRGWALPSLIVVTQLLIYVALNGPLARYRYPLQPLITLVAAGGLTWPLSRASGREALGKLPIRAWWNNGPLGRRPEESAPAGGPLAYRDTR